MIDKVWVVIGVFQGVVDKVEAFWHEGDAESAQAELDKEYGIERDEEGRHEHPENDVVVREVEIEAPTL